MQQNRKTVAAILAASLVSMSTLTLAPMVAMAADAFPSVELSVVQLLVTLASLLAVPSTLLTGALTSHMRKKPLLVLSLAFMLTGGTFPLLSHGDIGVLLGCSAVIGVGYGGVLTLAPALIADHFTGTERNRVMGLQSAAVSLGGALFTLLSGFLTVVHWYLAYLPFLLIVPILLIVLFCLPHGGKSGGGHVPGTARAALRGGQIWYLCGMNLVFSIFITTYSTNISLLLDERGFGGAVLSGIVSAVFTCGGAAAGFVGGRIITRLGAHSLAASTALGAAGMLLICLQSLPFVLVGSILAGMAFALRGSSGFSYAARALPQLTALPIALFASGGAVGQFVSSLLVNPLAQLFKPGAAARCALSGAALAVLAAVLLLFNPCSSLDISPRRASSSAQRH